MENGLVFLDCVTYMANKLYRVVESTWVRGERKEIDIGCEWKPEAAAKAELRQKVISSPSRQFGIQPESRKGK